ncbi:MAG: hypothetical protein A3F12_05460, partial [Gammaproteobacteria bacterium RIFCSPHIGHO2_12_FULL_38_14]
KDYNNALINRGRLTLWIDEKSINGWYENNPLDREDDRLSEAERAAIRSHKDRLSMTLYGKSYDDIFEEDNKLLDAASKLGRLLSTARQLQELKENISNISAISRLLPKPSVRRSDTPT